MSLTKPATPRLLLAPMEGMLDARLRDVVTRVGHYDWLVTEFVRVTDMTLPNRCFRRVAPELKDAARTPAGTPVRVQLLGSDPFHLANNAARLVALEPAGVDLNFGCPAPTVNRHRGFNNSQVGAKVTTGLGNLFDQKGTNLRAKLSQLNAREAV